MKVVYEPKGRAKEYADLAFNTYLSCPHGCRYCYAPSAMHKTRECFHSKATTRATKAYADFAAHPFVDLWKVGKLNYLAEANGVDWAAFRAEFVARADEAGAEYVLKKSLLEA